MQIISRGGGDDNAKKSLRGTQSCGVGGGGGGGVGIGGGSLPNVNNISSQNNSPPAVSFIKVIESQMYNASSDWCGFFVCTVAIARLRHFFDFFFFIDRCGQISSILECGFVEIRAICTRN